VDEIGDERAERPIDDQEDESYLEQVSYFVGECTCSHVREDHGWGRCDVDGCDCEAGWEE
jgi:hypothetical protein